MKASEAGADIITVLGVSDDTTIAGAVAEARERGKQIMVDMINVPNLEQRAREIDALGVDYICVHAGYDHQAAGKNSFAELRTIKGVVEQAKTAVAGGIKLATIEEVIAAEPDLVIVGGGITGVDDKPAVAAAMQRLVRGA
jgi:3-hexulose-6-phosphate synthase